MIVSRPIVVSGATGFLGSALCRHLTERGLPVRALARHPPSVAESPASVSWYRWALPDAPDASALAGASAVVHCAYDMRPRTEEAAREVNVAGAARLFAAARAAGARIVFVSSMSAHPEAVSIYGRSKLEVEARLSPDCDLVVRPGHIIGEGGVFWRTAQMIARLPFIPLFYGGHQLLQTIHVDDVCRAIELALEQDLRGRILLSERQPLPLRDFYGAIAAALGRDAWFVRLPGEVALLSLRCVERLGFTPPLSSDNLLGLKHLRSFDVGEDLRRLGLDPRTARESLAEIKWTKLVASR